MATLWIIADIDGDGHLDIFAAEQGKWTRGTEHARTIRMPLPGFSTATARGTFRTTLLAKGQGWHDSKIADLDGEGDLDILQHPYAWDAPRIDVWLQNGTGPVHPWKPKVAPSVKPPSTGRTCRHGTLELTARSWSKGSSRHSRHAARRQVSAMSKRPASMAATAPPFANGLMPRDSRAAA